MGSIGATFLVLA
jgi:hypothetical protein